MDRLRPFFSYYGGKYRLARHYPPPEHETIVEPFAGSAGYSVWHAERNVVLVDSNPKVAAVWKYLIETPSEEVARLPVDFRDVRELDIPDAAKWFIGFRLQQGSVHPGNRPSAFCTGKASWSERFRDAIAAQCDRIRHWTVIHGDFSAAPGVTATWLVDPPYSTPAGRMYTFQVGDPAEYRRFVRSRSGLVIECSGAGGGSRNVYLRAAQNAPGRHKSQSLYAEYCRVSRR